MKRLLITGGSSYLGQHLAPLAAKGAEVCYTYYQHPLPLPGQGTALDVRDETAGRQTLTRAAFSLKMLDWWNVHPRHSLRLGPAQGEKWPLDCELDLAKANSVLDTPLLGVDEILSEPTLYL